MPSPMLSDVVFTSVRELGERVRSGALSPVALTTLFLERLDTLGPRYNAVVTITRERAMDTSPAGRKGDRLWALPRPVARHSLWCERSARYFRWYPNHLGRGAVSPSNL